LIEMIQNLQSPKTADIRDPASEPIDTALGIFSALSLILLLWGFCWLKEYSPWRPPQCINVIFTDIAGLNDNASVNVDGVRIGMVDKVEWQSEHRVLVRLRISSTKVVVPQGSKFEILTNGIIGAKYIQIDLPHVQAGIAALPAIDEKMEVHGEPPIRPELAVNKLAITLSNIDVNEVGRNFTADRRRLVRAADQLALLAEKTMPLVDRGLPLENNLIVLSTDLRRASKKIGEIMDNPKFSSDLKSTAQSAKETAQSLESAMKGLDSTLSDKPLRQDLLQAFDQLHQSTINIEKSLDSLKQITGDKDLRSDIKQTLAELHSTLQKTDEIMNKPKVSDARSTLQTARDLIEHFDLACQQMNQILNKRSPIMHLLMGRPGKIEQNKPMDHKK